MDYVAQLAFLFFVYWTLVRPAIKKPKAEPRPLGCHLEEKEKRDFEREHKRAPKGEYRGGDYIGISEKKWQAKQRQEECRPR